MENLVFDIVLLLLIGVGISFRKPIHAKWKPPEKIKVQVGSKEVVLRKAGFDSKEKAWYYALPCYFASMKQGAKTIRIYVGQVSDTNEVSFKVVQ